MKIARAILFCAATLLLYLGVPLLGWGVGNITGFFSSGARIAYALVVTIFSLAVGVQSLESIQGIRGGSGETGKLIMRQRIVRIGLILFLYLALFFIPFFDRSAIGVLGFSSVIRWLGVPLSALGYALIFLSGLALGRQYSQDVTIQEHHQLITTGIFSLIRHPRYMGIMALGMGFSLVFRSWIGLVVIALASVVLLFRIRDEEMLLHQEFGQQWEAYCIRSWRLVPYFY